MNPLNTSAFERSINGKQTRLINLTNKNGLEATLSTYGARIIVLQVNGVNVTPAYPSLDDYMNPEVAPYHGATIGRYANRIAKGKFTLNGKDYNLPVNNGFNHLHGGPQGFHTKVWTVDRETENEVRFSLFSPDGEEGYPGNLQATVTYSLSAENELVISYTATSDADTPFNITNHAFFNLNGEGSILNHTLQINASQFNPVDETLIPTGIQSVEDSAFDFRESKLIGRDIDKEEKQIRIGGGYDHNFILNKKEGELSFAGVAKGEKSGIVMDVLTTEPSMQLFSGNFEAVKGDANTFRNTFCLETQHFPDSPNQPGFPSAVLKAGEEFRSKTIYKFTTFR